MRYIIELSMIIVATVFSSCSVLEERAGCPCWLEVYVEDMPSSGAQLSIVASGNKYSESVALNESGDCIERLVPRGSVSVSAFGKSSCFSISDGKYEIVPGNQSDSLYSFSRNLCCEDDFVVDTVSLRKQFATVFLFFKNDVEMFPFDLVVTGNVCGMDTATSAPISGDFLYRPSLSSDGRCSFRLPRQLDKSLVLGFVSRESGEVSDELSLGGMIVDGGYDWSALNLNDIVVEIEFSEMKMKVKVTEWDGREPFEVVI